MFRRRRVLRIGGAVVASVVLVWSVWGFFLLQESSAALRDSVSESSLDLYDAEQLETVISRFEEARGSTVMLSRSSAPLRVTPWLWGCSNPQAITARTS